MQISDPYVTEPMCPADAEYQAVTELIEAWHNSEDLQLDNEQLETLVKSAQQEVLVCVQRLAHAREHFQIANTTYRSLIQVVNSRGFEYEKAIPCVTTLLCSE